MVQPLTQTFEQLVQTESETDLNIVNTVTAPPKESMYLSRVPWIFLFGGISENSENCRKITKMRKTHGNKRNQTL